jgi:hypothetical protein
MRYCLFRFDLGIPAYAVYGSKNSVIATTRAPARFCPAIVVECEVPILDFERPVTF